MEPFTIVPNPNVLKYASFGYCPALKYAVRTLSFQREEKTLRTSIIITISLATHADLAVFLP